MMNDNTISIPHAKPISRGVAGTTCLTQLTMTTGAVCKVDETARVAPVSLTLLVKTIIAPERIEYLVNGKTIDLKTVNGFAPNVLPASSMSMLILSMAADIDLTKYGYVIARWAKISSMISGMPVKPCQKNFSEMPKAIDGTIKGMLISKSRIVEGSLPNVFRAIRMAMGIPVTIPRTVTMAPSPYDNARACQ